jgi:dTDP-4-amino-4,6-dideoxygalactose transaminase
MEEKRNVPLSRLWITKDEFKEVKKVLETGWLTKGPKNIELEKMVSEYLGVKHVICTSSCTTALHLALVSLGIITKQGEEPEVLVADYTYPATGHSVIYSGLKPVFVDIDMKTYNMDYKDLKKKINKKKTKAIIVVHTFGQSAEMNKIMKIANKKNIPVIEDAACALGSKYKGQFCGTIGKIGCFSMHATKGVATGEGGLLVTNDDEIAERARSFGAFGLNTWKRETSKEFEVPVFENIGFNYKMSDLAASVGIAQFRKLDKIIKKKNALARYWNKRLKEIDYVDAPYIRKGKGNIHNYQGYNCLDRNKLIQLLKNNGIQCQIGTYCSYIQPCYNNEQDNCQNSFDVYNRSIRLPLFYKLKRSDIDYIIDILKEIRNEVFI